VAALYVDRSVSHPGNSQRRPACARDAASLPAPGVPYRTLALFVLFIAFLPSCGPLMIRRAEGRGRGRVGREGEPSVYAERTSVLRAASPRECAAPASRGSRYRVPWTGITPRVSIPRHARRRLANPLARSVPFLCAAPPAFFAPARRRLTPTTTGRGPSCNIHHRRGQPRPHRPRASPTSAYRSPSRRLSACVGSTPPSRSRRG
jgi:hypothetical protein